MEARVEPSLLQHDLRPDNLSDSEFALRVQASMLGSQLAPYSVPGPETYAAASNQWAPNQNTPRSSSRPRPLDYFSLPTARLTNQQDAWNPLQVTGVPEQAAGYAQPFNKAYQGDDIGSGYPKCQYSPSSGCDGKYNPFSSSDSGYGSKSGTASSVATSFVVDSAFGSQTSPNECKLAERTPAFEQNTGPHDETSNGAHMSESLSEPLSFLYQDLRCSYPGCDWTAKCPSDKRKHEARHQKLFRCDEPNCPRKEGFGTLNDLARHKKCVHHQEPERGPKVMYKCFAENCSRGNKKWPRLDNFRQHLARMHNKENEDELLKRSREWYEKYVKPQQPIPSVVDRFARDDPKYQAHPILDSGFATETSQPDTCNSVAPGRTMISAETAKSAESLILNPIKGLSVQDGARKSNAVSNQRAPSGSHPLELPALNSLNLPASIKQGTQTSRLIHGQNAKVENFVTEAAGNMINLMTNIMNGNQRRWSQQSDSEDDTDEQRCSELSSGKRDMLRKILWSALTQLGGSPTPNLPVPDETGGDPAKKDWMKCGLCPKRTRLPCEMKKHQKSHEKPYGCTFMTCYQTFGKKCDWKRHENELHFRQECWRCDLEDQRGKGLSCAQLFHKKHLYVSHLETEHKIAGYRVEESVWISRMGNNGQSRYWCGFCRKILPLTSRGLLTGRERLDHVDEHFKKGERIGEWLPESGHLTKAQAREKENRKKLAADQPGTVECSDTDGTSSSASDDGGRKSDRKLTGQFAQNLPISSRGASSIYCSKPEPNQRKRKSASPHSEIEPSGQCHTAGSPPMKRQTIAESAVSCTNSCPATSRTSYQAAEGQEQSSTIQSERNYSGNDGLPQDQYFVYCCQCKDGPFYPDTIVQCINCNHAVCANCEVKGLPPADEFV